MMVPIRVAAGVVSVGECDRSRADPAADSALTALARPKSNTFTTSSGRSLMFAGLRSRWTMPCSCAASSASAIWRAMDSASSTGMTTRKTIGQRRSFNQLETRAVTPLVSSRPWMPPMCGGSALRGSAPARKTCDRSTATKRPGRAFNARRPSGGARYTRPSRRRRPGRSPYGPKCVPGRRAIHTTRLAVDKIDRRVGSRRRDLPASQQLPVCPEAQLDLRTVIRADHVRLRSVNPASRSVARRRRSSDRRT